MNTIVTAILLAVFASACSSTAPAPACNPAAPVGTWTTGETGQAKTLALLVDSTFVEETPAGEIRGTWSTDGANITFNIDATQDHPHEQIAARPYFIAGDELIIDGPSRVIWNPICP